MFENGKLCRVCSFLQFGSFVLKIECLSDIQLLLYLRRRNAKKKRYFSPNQGGLFRGSFLGDGRGEGIITLLSKTRWSYARNLKFGKYTLHM